MAKVDRDVAGSAAVADPPQEKFPIPPSRNLDIDQLLVYWASIPNVFQSRLSAYLYRLWPYTDVRVNDPEAKKYICVFASSPKNKEQILREWGTGEYKLQLTDLDRTLGRGEVCTSRFKFFESYADYPPVLDYATLDLGRKENKSYVEWLRSNGKLPNMTPQQQGGAGDAAVQGLVSTLNTVLPRLLNHKQEPGSTDQTFSKIIEMFATANKTSLDMALSQVKQNSPKEMLELITLLQSAFHQPAPSNSSEKLLELFLKMHGENSKAIAEAANKNTELMLKLIESKLTRNDNSGLGGVRELVETFVSLQGMLGGRGRSNHWAVDLFAPVLPQAMGVLDKFASAIPLFVSRRPQAGGNQGGMAPPPPGANVYPSPPPPPAGLAGPPPPVSVTGTTSGQPMPDIQPPAAPAEDDPMVMELKAILQTLWKPMMVQINLGVHGGDFADWVAAGFGMTISEHAQLKARFQAAGGPAGVLKLIHAMDPMGTGAWGEVQPIQPQFLKFAEEFLAWEPSQGGDEGGEVDPPGAVQ